MKSNGMKGVITAVLSLIMASGAVGVGGWVRADEEKVEISQLPKAVSDAVKTRFPKIEMVSASKETEDGKTVYEVTLKNKGKSIDVSVSLEGKLQAIEKEVAKEDLPKAVAERFDAKYAKSTIKRIEEVIHVKGGKESLDYYEFLVEVSEKEKVEVLVSPEGKITKEVKQ